MRIKKIKTQNRRDFIAIYECESCDLIIEANGYDDDYFHQEVIPKMICPKCGLCAPKSYRPLVTKYPADMLL